MVVQDKYINPFTDFGFKKIFGSEPNKALLIDFLNEVVLPRQRSIVELSYQKNEQVGRTEFDRKAIFDLYCIGKNDERFIVEMQKAKQNYFKDRSVFYATFPIQEQAIRGEWDYKLAEVFTVGVLDFVFGEEKTAKDTKNKAISIPNDNTDIPKTDPQPPKTKEVRHVVQLKDQKNQVFYDKLTFIYLEMPNFTKEVHELETQYDKWLYVLKNLSTLANRPDILQEKIFEQLFEIAEIAKFTSTERDQYEESLKNYRDLKNVIDTAFGDGKIEGKKEGKIEGIIEGKKEGELATKTKAIIKALNVGKLSTEEIAEYNDVTIEFILRIKKENQL
jgi:predicted transposase/invertase (TIGR01784 family)